MITKEESKSIITCDKCNKVIQPGFRALRLRWQEITALSDNGYQIGDIQTVGEVCGYCAADLSATVKQILTA